MNQNVQFEERKCLEKQSFEHPNHEQTKNALNQQWNQSRQRAQAKLEMIHELHSVVLLYQVMHCILIMILFDPKCKNKLV